MIRAILIALLVTGCVAHTPEPQRDVSTPYVVYLWLRYDTQELRDRYPQPTVIPTRTLDECRKIERAYATTGRRVGCYRRGGTP